MCKSSTSTKSEEPKDGEFQQWSFLARMAIQWDMNCWSIETGRRTWSTAKSRHSWQKIVPKKSWIIIIHKYITESSELLNKLLSYSIPKIIFQRFTKPPVKISCTKLPIHLVDRQMHRWWLLPFFKIHVRITIFHNSPISLIEMSMFPWFKTCSNPLFEGWWRPTLPSIHWLKGKSGKKNM